MGTVNSPSHGKEEESRTQDKRAYPRGLYGTDNVHQIPEGSEETEEMARETVCLILEISQHYRGENLEKNPGAPHTVLRKAWD